MNCRDRLSVEIHNTSQLEGTSILQLATIKVVPLVVPSVITAGNHHNNLWSSQSLTNCVYQEIEILLNFNQEHSHLERWHIWFISFSYYIRLFPQIIGKEQT